MVATDTMKNTLYVLAHAASRRGERAVRARSLAAHFLDRHAQVSGVTRGARGARLDTPDRSRGAAASTLHAARSQPFTRLSPALDASASRRTPPLPPPRCTRSADAALPASAFWAAERTSPAFADSIILKSTASGFAGFHRDELTTLPETDERILATAARATWRWTREPVSYRAAQRTIIDAMLVPFAERHSPSVQATLFEMATAALNACPEIAASR